MKIVHVVYSLEMGGAEVLVAQLCRIQTANGHDVSICAYSKLGAVGETLRAEGVDIYVPGEAHPATTMWRYFNYFQRVKPDVVHSHNPAPTLQASLSARLAGVRRVISTRHSLVAPPYEVREEIKYNVMALFCDWIVGICEITCENLRGAPLAHKGKIVRVYNGAESIARTDVAKETTGKFVLLFVGRLAAIKDLGMVIRAVASAKDRVANLEFWVVGDGPVRGSLEDLARELGITDRVRLWGQQMVTAGYFSRADVFVMSSMSEGLPMSLLQAMSIGLPAITTDVGGMAEVLRLTGSGVLVPVGDSDAMAEAIVKVADDAGKREELSRLALEVYNAEFTLEKMDEGYMKLYQ